MEQCRRSQTVVNRLSFPPGMICIGNCMDSSAFWWENAHEIDIEIARATVSVIPFTASAILPQLHENPPYAV